MRKFTTHEEREEIIAILEQKPEIDKKLAYYKESLLAIDGVMKAIDERVERGYTTEQFTLLFIPIIKRVMLDEYDKSRLILEKKRAELDLFEKKRYFEMWLDRSKKYDEKFEYLKKECEENYDAIFEQAKEVSKSNIRLANTMEAYKNEENDMKIKVEFYLYIKQEVENNMRHNKNRPKFEPQPAQ